MSEKNAWDTLRQRLFGPRDRFDRIENLVGLGFPDTNCCLDGVEFWIELKAGDEPKRPGSAFLKNNHPISQEQKNWFLRQRQAGGIAYIYIETDRRRLLIHGSLADGVNEMSATTLEASALWCSLRPTQTNEWIQLRELLTHPERE